MTKHTILFPYYQRYQYYQNQNNVNQQDANQSGHRHKKSIPLLSPSAGWLRVVCFPHYTIHQCKAQSKICLSAIFQTVLPKNVKPALVKSEKMTTDFRLSATCAPVFHSVRQPPSVKMEAAAASRTHQNYGIFYLFSKKWARICKIQNPSTDSDRISPFFSVKWGRPTRSCESPERMDTKC